MSATVQAWDFTYASTFTSTIAKAFGANVTAGNVMVALVNNSDGRSVSNIVDTLGSTWTRAAQQVNEYEFWWAPVPSTGANTVTATLSGNANKREIIITEISGLAITGQPEAFASNSGTSATATSGNLTMAGGGFIAAYMKSGSNYVTWSAGSGYTGVSGPTGTSNKSLLEFRHVGAGGTYNPSGSQGSSQSFTIVGVAFKDAGAPPPAGVLNFQATGMEFGRRTGLGISTFALDANSGYVYQVYADGLSLGAAIYTSGVVSTDSVGKLPNYSSLSLTVGTTYRIVATRQADGEAAIFRMVATS